MNISIFFVSRKAEEAPGCHARNVTSGRLKREKRDDVVTPHLDYAGMLSGRVVTRRRDTHGIDAAAIDAVEVTADGVENADIKKQIKEK